MLNFAEADSSGGVAEVQSGIVTVLEMDEILENPDVYLLSEEGSGQSQGQGSSSAAAGDSLADVTDSLLNHSQTEVDQS